jgi:inward rectifier potassium channel
MALLRKINSKARTAANTGFGINASDYGGRFVNKDGRPNIEKRGLTIFERISLFHSMLALPRWKFFLLIFAFYIVVNIFFALIYYFLGVEHLNGMSPGTELEKLGEAFFFSAQTFTTVGYGRISPEGFGTSAVAALEALIGLLSLALATGLLYGRFSKPTAYIKFSHNALIAPYKEINALMLRIAPYKNITLTDAEAKVMLGIAVQDNGTKRNTFYPLDLELSLVNSLNLSWTIVHPITEESPLFDFTQADYESVEGEFIIYVKAFDDMFSNIVVARSSYTFKEIVYGAKFIPMYHQNEAGNKTILDLEKLNHFVPAALHENAATREKTASS